MSPFKQRFIQLTEYQPAFFEQDELAAAAMMRLHRQFRGQIMVEPPSAFNQFRWKITPQGIVGTLPISPNQFFLISPKSPIANLFGMIAVVYRIDLRFFQGVYQCRSLPEFFDLLAATLAEKSLSRCRQGLYKSYLPRHNRPPAIRGKLNLRQTIVAPWQIPPYCFYQEASTDIRHNQILVYALELAAKNPATSPKVRGIAGKAFRALSGYATSVPITTTEAGQLSYNRLNRNYEPLHALCRFILDHASPALASGDDAMLPFLIDMNRLYERFVTAWLKQQLPPPWRVEAQEVVRKGAGGQLHFQIDLTIYDGDNRPHMVLDIKYKNDVRPQQSDIQQIIAYAQVKECAQAALIYPLSFETPLDVQLRGLHLRSIPFRLDGDLKAAGDFFLQRLGTTEFEPNVIAGSSTGAASAPESSLSTLPA